MLGLDSTRASAANTPSQEPRAKERPRFFRVRLVSVAASFFPKEFSTLDQPGRAAASTELLNLYRTTTVPDTSHRSSRLRPLRDRQLSPAPRTIQVLSPLTQTTRPNHAHDITPIRAGECLSDPAATRGAETPMHTSCVAGRPE